MVTENLKKFSTPVFPFTAIVGQEEMKLALQLNVIDPKIGGVMIMGDRGTGKSTTIRAIADLLPEIEIVKDDPFNSHKSDLELMDSEGPYIDFNSRNAPDPAQWLDRNRRVLAKYQSLVETSIALDALLDSQEIKSD